MSWTFQEFGTRHWLTCRDPPLPPTRPVSHHFGPMPNRVSPSPQPIQHPPPPPLAYFAPPDTLHPSPLPGPSSSSNPFYIHRTASPPHAFQLAQPLPHRALPSLRFSFRCISSTPVPNPPSPSPRPRGAPIFPFPFRPPAPLHMQTCRQATPLPQTHAENSMRIHLCGAA